MKFTKPTLSIVTILGALYLTPAFAGATNTGDNTSATPGPNSSTTQTPVDSATPGTPAIPADPTVSPAVPAEPATPANTTDMDRTGKSMKDKARKDCEKYPTDKNCKDKTKVR